MSAASAELVREVRALSNPALAERLAGGLAIDPDAIADQDYDGYSLGLPAFAVALSWKTFRKSFHRDPVTGRLRGWNTRIDQREPEAFEPQRRRGRPLCFGHFDVVDLDPARAPRPVGRGLLLDYGPRAGRLDPLRALRDPVAALDAGAGALLGWSYLDLGFTRASTPSYFLLVRRGPLSHVEPA